MVGCMTVETMEVPAAQRLDERALDRFLAQHLPEYAGGLAVRQFPGGFSNPTYALATTDRAGTPRRYVLRKRPAGDLLPSAHRVDREFRVLQALAASDVPVPRARALCEDPAVLGTPFFVMDHVEGRLFADPTLPGCGTAERTAIYDSMNAVMARLHRVDPAAVGLADYGKAASFLQRQVELWTRMYRAAQTEDLPAMDALGAWLAAHLPQAPRAGIVHGDYRLNNLLVHPTEPRVIAVLDWELSTLGDPLCDLAYNCLCYYLPEPPVGFGGADTAALGIPSQEAYVEAYARRMGLDGLPHWNFYMALQLYKSASLLQGVYKRGLEGKAPAAALQKMRFVRERAALGLAIAEGGASATSR
jgi:aminoglycoside phosphotransferase (APT) family kinase protein